MSGVFLRWRVVVALLPLLAVAWLSTPARAASPPTASAASDDVIRRSIDGVFAQWDRWDSPGAAVAVVRDVEVFYQRGYGSAQLEYSIPITPETELLAESNGALLTFERTPGKPSPGFTAQLGSDTFEARRVEPIAGGQVNGLRLTGSRVRNLRFERR